MLKIWRLLVYIVTQLSFSPEWFNTLLRSKSNGQARALEMELGDSAGPGRSLLN